MDVALLQVALFSTTKVVMTARSLMQAVQTCCIVGEEAITKPVIYSHFRDVHVATTHHCRPYLFGAQKKKRCRSGTQ